MPKLKQAVQTFARDEVGGEVLEYVLVAGAIVVAVIAVILAVGGKVVLRWTSLNCHL